MLPKKREDRLVVQQLPRETLIYDLDRHKAHCLNEAASLVWRHCDGARTPADLAAMLRRELDMKAGQDAVRAILEQLSRASLLDSPPAAKRISRRSATRKLVGAGLAASVVTIAVPHAAQAVTGTMCCDPTGKCPDGFNCRGTGVGVNCPAECSEKCCIPK